MTRPSSIPLIIRDVMSGSDAAFVDTRWQKYPVVAELCAADSEVYASMKACGQSLSLGVCECVLVCDGASKVHARTHNRSCTSCNKCGGVDVVFLYAPRSFFRVCIAWTTGTIAQFAVFDVLGSDGAVPETRSTLIAGNYHLFGNPEAPQIRIFQMAMMLWKMEALVGSAGEGGRGKLLLCGDANAGGASLLSALLWHPGLRSTFGPDSVLRVGLGWMQSWVAAHLTSR